MYSRTRWRFSVIVTVLLLLAVALSACTPAPATPIAPDITPATEEGPAMPEDMADEQVLRYVDAGFACLNPAHESGAGRYVISHIFMPFFIRDDQHNIHPWLATGYDVSDDGLVYTVHIDERAVWSDGTPVTAQDAKAYWEYGLNPTQCVGCRLSLFAGFESVVGRQAVVDGEAEEVEGLVAVDGKTLQITLNHPDPLLPHRLALFDTGFAKMEDLEQAEYDRCFASDGDARVNGPFMIEKWDPDTQEFSIVQNPHWWGDKQPFIERIIAQTSQDENVSNLMWQNDEVDVANLRTVIGHKLSLEEPENQYSIPYGGIWYYVFKAQIPPMDDLMLRRALIHAVDWESALHATFDGLRDGHLADHLISPFLPCYTEDSNYPDFGYDPDLAREEFAQSKYAHLTGTDFPKIRISTTGMDVNGRRMAEIFIEAWNNILGITNAEVREGPWAAWGQEEDQINVLRFSLGSVLPDSAHYLNTFWGLATGLFGYEDLEISEMLPELTNMDRESSDYRDKIHETESLMLEHYFLLPMDDISFFYMVKPWVKNFGTNIDNNFATLLDMYIAEH